MICSTTLPAVNSYTYGSALQCTDQLKSATTVLRFTYMLIMHSSSFDMHLHVLHSSSFDVLQLSELTCRACLTRCLQPPHAVKCCLQQLYQMCMAAECMPGCACTSRFTKFQEVHTACTKPVCTAVMLHDISCHSPGTRHSASGYRAL